MLRGPIQSRAEERKAASAHGECTQSSIGIVRSDDPRSDSRAL